MNRVTKWLPKANRGAAPEGVEVYDHDLDPNENVNIAARPENWGLVQELSHRLRDERKQMDGVP